VKLGGEARFPCADDLPKLNRPAGVRPAGRLCLSPLLVAYTKIVLNSYAVHSLH
jgi:hypothetical protein